MQSAAVQEPDDPGDVQNQFTAIVERVEDGYIAYCAELPGANGQGDTREECLENLRVALILEHRREETLRGVPEGAAREIVLVG